MRGLPKGWATAPLDSLCQKLRGVSYKQDEASPAAKASYLPILRANNIEADRLTFDELVWVPASRVNEQQKLHKGDIVVAMSSGSKNVVGKTAQALASWDGAFGAFCGILRPSTELHSRFLGLFLRTREYRSQISALAAGSNINNLKNEHFAAIDVPLAPLNEQRRIVAKLEMLLDKVSASQNHLAKIPGILKHFRQSVLSAACSGNLTADWREKNPDASTVDSLRCKVERGGGNGELPQNWITCRVGDVMKLKNGFAFKSTDYTRAGVPLVRISNIQDGKVFLDNCAKIPSEKANWTFVIEKGDLLLAMSGATTGKLGIYNGDEKCLQNQRVGNIKILDPEEVLPGFRDIVLQSLKQRIEDDAYGGAQPNISPAKIEALPFNCPPLSEQQEIVHRVGKLFALVDHLEVCYNKAKSQVNKLAQSILAKAFRGELVPQDPNDEPASVLLDKIKQSVRIKQKAGSKVKR